MWEECMKKGEIYGHLKIISFPKTIINGKKFQTDAVECECLKCGNTTVVKRNNLVSGRTKTCGCLRKESQRNLNNNLTHVEGTCIEIISSDKLYKNNTSGVRGVKYKLHKGKYPVWVCRLTCQGKTHEKFFRYDEFDKAVEQRKKWEEEYFQPLVEKYSKSDETHIS